MISRFFGGRARSDPARRARIPSGLRIYAIGDIHGCAGLLDQLHTKIWDDLAQKPPTDAMLIYLGDYVDRGPDSAGVLERLSQPTPAGISRVFLKGNHEDMLGMFLDDPGQGAAWCGFGGFETLLSYKIDVQAVRAEGGYEALGRELAARIAPPHARFLADLGLSYSLGDYFFCHAGVRPRVPIEQQDPHDLMWIRHEFIASDLDHGKIVIHGHSAVEEPEVRSNRINVDTGAYATGRLTALVLEDADRRFLST